MILFISNSVLCPEFFACVIIATLAQYFTTIFSLNTQLSLFIYLFIYLIYLFFAAFGLHCCARAFSICGEWELLFVAVPGLLIAVASLVVERRL